MSARGWAGLLGTIADHAETWEEPFAADLRELAALLERTGETHPLTDLAEAVEDGARFTDEHLLSAEEIALGHDTSTSRVARQAATLLRSLARGLAEQQEGGR